MQAEIHQGGGYQRQHDGEQQNAPRIVVHLVTQRIFVKGHLDQNARIDAGRADHPQDPVARLDQGDEGIANEPEGGFLAQIECGVDGRRRPQHLIGRGRHARRHRMDPGMNQQVSLKLRRDHTSGAARNARAAWWAAARRSSR